MDSRPCCRDFDPAALRLGAGASELVMLRDAAFEPVRVRMIPYFAFANRGESEMLVWALARRG